MNYQFNYWSSTQLKKENMLGQFKKRKTTNINPPMLHTIGNEQISTQEVADRAGCSKSSVSEFMKKSDMTAAQFIEYWHRRTNAKKTKKIQP